MQHKISWDIQDLVDKKQEIMMNNPDKYEELTQAQEDQIWQDLSGIISKSIDEHIGEVLHEIEYAIKDNLKEKR